MDVAMRVRPVSQRLHHGLAKDASFRRPACTSGTLMKRFQSRRLRKFSDHDDDRYLIDRQVGARMPVAAFAKRMYEAEPTPDAMLQLRQEIAQRAHRLVRRVGKARKRSARRDHSPRRLSSQSRWAAWFSTASRTTSSPRPNRSRSGRRMCRPLSTSPTIRCFRPQFLVSRHADQTARLDKFHAPSDQRAEMPIPPLSAGRNMAMRTAELVRGRSAGIAAAWLPVVSRSRGRPEGPAARGKLCRSLRSGVPVLQQPGRARAEAYRHSADLEQG